MRSHATRLADYTPSQERTSTPFLASVGLQPGQWQYESRLVAAAVMPNPIFSHAARVLEVIKRHTIGNESIYAITYRDGKKKPRDLTSLDIRKDTGLEKGDVRRAISDLEKLGIAQRETLDGSTDPTKFHKNRIRIRINLKPTPPPEPPKEKRVTTMVERQFKQLARRLGVKLPPDLALEADDHQGLEVLFKEHQPYYEALDKALFAQALVVIKPGAYIEETNTETTAIETESLRETDGRLEGSENSQTTVSSVRFEPPPPETPTLNAVDPELQRLIDEEDADEIMIRQALEDALQIQLDPADNIHEELAAIVEEVGYKAEVMAEFIHVKTAEMKQQKQPIRKLGFFLTAARRDFRLFAHQNARSIEHLRRDQIEQPTPQYESVYGNVCQECQTTGLVPPRDIPPNLPQEAWWNWIESNYLTFCACDHGQMLVKAIKADDA